MQKSITQAIAERILVLDGAMGTMIQGYGLTEIDFRGERFATWGYELDGCNDILTLTRPDILKDIHREYLASGADIISTCSFNSHPISLLDYGLESMSYEIAHASAKIAREVADEFNLNNPHKPRFVAGSVGPTNRTASMSADVSNPASREVLYDELYEGYMTQVRGLIEGGVDIILLETIFDSLNAKAALLAIDDLGRELGRKIHTMASGTLADTSGRTLSGQTVGAFYNSLSHASLLSIGFNCAFGARDMMPYLEELSRIAGCPISAHPNAGLPNVMGGYDETPEMFASDVEEYLRRGLINIVGGCCGTTPRHIMLINELVKGYSPRVLPKIAPTTTLSGLEPLIITPESNFINIGERSNVAGSAKFARLIREGSYEEALSIVRAQVDSGAQIIDVCMDDGMIDAEEAMHHFLALMASEPEIARVPTVIDSSKWEVLLRGLKISQGKSIVNSISLKEGEAIFLQRAMQIHRMGGAAIVMLFDEEGQADSYERKIEIAQRGYNLLVGAGFPADDIIFDANVLAVATGMEEHDRYGVAFIEATRWIKSNLPHCRVSGGVSNLSFAFRGNNTIREAMHSVFLYHAIEAGMDMAIVNAGMLQIYDQIEPTLLERVEDVILCRRPDASERLIEFAEQIKGQASGKKEEVQIAAWRELPLLGRIEHAMVKGVVEYIEEDALEGYNTLGSPIRVIDELLMPSMERVGRLFGEGQMFLPQVVKSARVMKRAVERLTPYIEALRGSEESASAGRVLIATVKGDVHDIGKNIVSVVMACNGYEIIDLGVMVETRRIVDEAVATASDVICMSGLITPSLDEMIRVVSECESRGLKLPIIIGGATTSPLHTAVKIAPHYSGVVIHAHNASDNPKILASLLGENRDSYIEEIEQSQASLRESYERALVERDLLPLEEARALKSIQQEIEKPLHTGRVILHDYEVSDLEPLIDWNFFFPAWGLKGRYPEILESEKYGEEATKLHSDAVKMLNHIKKNRSLTPQGVVTLLPARSEGDDIVVTSTKGEEVRLPMLRCQSRGDGRSLADIVAPEGDHIACFALTAGVGLEALCEEFRAAGDDYSAMLAKLLCDRLTEAFAEALHTFVKQDMWGFEGDGIRVAFGYPSVPDHSLKREVFELLGAEKITQMRLNHESSMITPGESICGLILPRGEFFSVGKISGEQIEDYASRRGVSTEEIKRLIPNNI